MPGVGGTEGRTIIPEPVMPKPLVAIPADIREVEGTQWHATPVQYVRAAVGAAGVMPVIVPALEDNHDIDAILDRVDGVLLSGSRTNVHPSHYGLDHDEAHGPFDLARDATSLPMIRRALDRGIPLLAICRGIQELNVALGGTLETEIQEKPGRDDHRRIDSPNRDEMYKIRQPVIIREGSCIAKVLGAGEVMVNTLHRQAIGATAPQLAVEALAEDGTIEAVSVIDAKGFAIGVQWHPEYWAHSDQPSNAIFRAFGDAVRAYREDRAARPV